MTSMATFHLQLLRIQQGLAKVQPVILPRSEFENLERRRAERLAREHRIARRYAEGRVGRPPEPRKQCACGRGMDRRASRCEVCYQKGRSMAARGWRAA